jgi:hypothetical protein
LDDDNWFAKMFLFLLQMEAMFEKANEVDKIPQVPMHVDTPDVAFVQKVLVGHAGTSYELFRMQRDTFASLANVLRANYLKSLLLSP